MVTSIVWFRQDLRLEDQAALAAAIAEGPVVALYVLDDETPGGWRIGGAQRWWLHHSLAALDERLRAVGSRLILRRGAAAEMVAQVAQEADAARVHAIRHYEPWWIAAEAALSGRLELVLHDGNQLAPPEDVRSGSGGHYRMFSAFWSALSALMPPPAPVAAPTSIDGPALWPAGDELTSWALLPSKPDWAAAFGKHWRPGEAGAHAALEAFAGPVRDYDEQRDLPSHAGTSRLSPHLHHGEISPATVWHSLGGADPGVRSFRRELGWRDFTAGVVARTPDYGDRNGRPAFDQLQWRTGAAAEADLRAWQRGLTGYPIVDAGMRQLWTMGWMHNRVRMITASFLIKHLLIDWREGERWFWDCLVDADYGNNAVNWQWVAGTGVDSNMFGRIMAPLVQSEKFDAGDYIREWVPELRGVAGDAIHDPHEAGVAVDYPEKLIGHREGRERALTAARAMRS